MRSLIVGLAAVTLGTTAAAQDSLTGPGVSEALARYRAARIRDVRYDLRLDVTARDTARGRVTVRFVRSGEGDAVLDFRGPRLRAVRANGRTLPTTVWNGAHLRLPERVLRAGANTLELEFASLIAPSGASVIRFHDPGDGSDYLYTLLVPADANQLFPCFDQPDLKAKVTLALGVPPAWSAVSNGAQLAREPGAGGVVTVRFAETPPISTYLIAFAAGPWKTVRRTAHGRPITMYVRASRAAEAEADSLIDQNARAAAWLERYFGLPFPFPKLDFVLAPVFPFGGMEHPGAIFYNEDRFVFRERATQVQRIGRANTIYHEVAHQWFGDLVTMRWFDDLWLKEGFATYMAAKMQDALDPASGAWKTFYLRNKPLAYEVDVTAGTNPVWQSLANLDQAKSNYGAIVYNKAPGVLKQLNYLVGDEPFRRGLGRFLRAHAYANATWRDLLAAIGAEAKVALDDWGAQYILRPGMPVIEQRRDGRIADYQGANGRLRGRQEHGLQIMQRPADPAVSGPAPWPIRTKVLFRYDDGTEDTVAMTLDRQVAGRWAPKRDRSPTLVFANAGDEAYALTLLDDESVAWLEGHIGDVRDDFLRAMLWGAMWDLVREARFDPARYVAIALRELPRERDEQIASSVLGRTVRAARAYLSSAARDSMLPRVESALRSVADDSTRPYGIRKAHLDALIAVAGTPATLAALDSMLDRPTAAGEPLRAPTRWAIVTALVARGAGPGDARLAAEQRRDTTSDGLRRAFIAAAARPDTSTKRRYFERYFADSTLNEDWATASLGAFNALDQQALTLPYLVPALDSLPWIQRNRRIFYLGSWLDAFLGGQTSRDALRRVNAFLETNPALPADLRRKVLQSADELARVVRIRERYGN